MLDTQRNVGAYQDRGKPTIASLFPDATLTGNDLRQEVPGWFRGYDVANFPGLTSSMFIGKDKLRRQDIMAMYQAPQGPAPAAPTVKAPTPYGQNAFGAAFAPMTFGSMLGRQPAL